MIPLRRRPTLLLLAAACVAPLATPLVARGEERMQVMRIAERCEIYGPGFVDIGNGACGQIVNGGRIHADGGPQGWPTAGTSNAALRSGTLGGATDPAGDGLGMIRGASGAQHLRIGGDTYGR